MNPIPQAVWLKVANRRKLRTWWAEVMFNLEDEDEAQAVQESVNKALRSRGVPDMAILAYQTILPLLLEANAIRAFVEDNPTYLNSLPEVLNRREALALARLEWPQMERIEMEALSNLLPKTMGAVNSLWMPGIKRAVAKLKPEQTKPR